MTAEQLARIYEPFAQADTSTTRKYGGTGLGLSITKNFIELMGGMLIVESTPGIGSKFGFNLTFDTIDLAAGGVSKPEIVIDMLEKPAFEGDVLICEDNAMNQLVIRESLARVGLKAVIAENGREGVDMVCRRIERGEKPFDLIFMDIQMPIMDGLEAASIIAKLHTGTPIIAMTANIMSDEKELYRESGMPDYVSKPFTSQELWRCLMKYLNPAKRESAPKSMQFEADMDFEKTLQMLFAKNNQTKFEEIAGALESGDIKLAHRLAHTLKSNAGQLGKSSLQSIAADVERQLKGGENLVTEEQLKVLEAELRIVLDELASLLNESSPKPETTQPPAIEPEKTRELFEKLEPLLKGGNPECLHFVNDLRMVPGSGRLIQQMEDFEFESAFSSFAELRKGWV
jgi:CheY-like chemotaxis protein